MLHEGKHQVVAYGDLYSDKDVKLEIDGIEYNFPIQDVIWLRNLLGNFIGESRSPEYTWFNKGLVRVSTGVNTFNPGVSISSHCIYIEFSQTEEGAVLISFEGEHCYLNNEVRLNLIKNLKTSKDPEAVKCTCLKALIGNVNQETPKEKLTYEQILQLKKEYEDEIYRKPKLVDSGAFYRKDDRRILQTAVMLAECDIPYTVQKYKDYLRKKSIPLSYLEKINNYLNEHYNQK